MLADVSEPVVEIARRAVARMDGVDVLRADARALPLADASVSVAHSSLLLHHLDPPDVVTRVA